jgi:glutathionyl-hydroquinone reductase
MLVNGKWTAGWPPAQSKDTKGGFVRQASQFRNWITADGRPGPTGEGGFPAERERYHLYAALTLNPTGIVPLGPEPSLSHYVAKQTAHASIVG